MNGHAIRGGLAGLALAAVWVGLAGAPGLHAGQGASGGRDLILVVDLSKSMAGAGGAPRIFGQVQQTLRQLVAELAVGDAVTLVTFDAAAIVHPTVTLLSEAERHRVFDLIDRLQARGDWTYTADGLAAGLKEADRLSALRGPGSPPPTLLVLTDGRNDPPPAARTTAPSLESVTKPYKGRPWFVYQVQLGPQVDRDLERALNVFEHGGTIHDPGGVRLPALPERIAERTTPPGVQWDVAPREVRLDLARLDADVVATVTASATVAGRRVGEIEVALVDADFPAQVTVAHEVASDARGIAIRVVGRLTADAPDGDFVARLRLSVADTAADGVTDVPVRVAVSLPRPWPVWAWVLLGSVLFGATGATVVGLRRQRLLFGSLVAWRSGEATARIQVDDLSRFGTRVALGPARGIALPGSDRPLAEFSTVRHDGRRHVRVRPVDPATIEHRGRREAELVLFDGDEFAAGGWHIRYRGEVDRRRPGSTQLR